MIFVQVAAFFAVVYALYRIVRFTMDGVDDYFVTHDGTDDNLPRDKHKPNGG